MDPASIVGLAIFGLLAVAGAAYGLTRRRTKADDRRDRDAVADPHVAAAQHITPRAPWQG